MIKTSNSVDQNSLRNIRDGDITAFFCDFSATDNCPPPSASLFLAADQKLNCTHYFLFLRCCTGVGTPGESNQIFPTKSCCFAFHFADSFTSVFAVSFHPQCGSRDTTQLRLRIKLAITHTMAYFIMQHCYLVYKHDISLADQPNHQN